jgi:hypothetical protein
VGIQCGIYLKSFMGLGSAGRCQGHSSGDDHVPLLMQHLGMLSYSGFCAGCLILHLLKARVTGTGWLLWTTWRLLVAWVAVLGRGSIASSSLLAPAPA